jgi:hypothetical protein
MAFVHTLYCAAGKSTAVLKEPPFALKGGLRHRHRVAAFSLIEVVLVL